MGFMGIKIDLDRSESRKNSPFGLLLAAILCGLIGGVLVFGIAYPIFNSDAKGSEGWPTVDGVVTQSEVTSSRDSANDTLYGHDLSYSYSVDGRDYEGDVRYFGQLGGASNIRDLSDSLVKKYPVGKAVQVSYKPEDPSVACLEPGVAVRSRLALFGGIALLGFAALLGIWGLLKLIRFIVLLAAATKG